MNYSPRISSVLHAQSLDTSVLGLDTFNLSDLNLEFNPVIELPKNLRLGHLIERIVSELIKASTNYKLLHENVQIEENNTTIGELDFIIKERATGRHIHLELAYKFYLYDPAISSNSINNWIGPNRNDFLHKKLKKTQSKQFPLLYHSSCKSVFPNLNINSIEQKLCLLTSLYIPYQYEGKFGNIFKKCTQGYYLDLARLKALDHSDKCYYLPLKTEWGIDPADHNDWKSFNDIEKSLESSISHRRALLCWQKSGEVYSSFFVVWW